MWFKKEQSGEAEQLYSGKYPEDQTLAMSEYLSMGDEVAMQAIRLDGYITSVFHVGDLPSGGECKLPSQDRG